MQAAWLVLRLAQSPASQPVSQPVSQSRDVRDLLAIRGKAEVTLTLDFGR